MSDYNEHLITLAGGDDKTPTRLEQIQEREQAATAGPWERRHVAETRSDVFAIDETSWGGEKSVATAADSEFGACPNADAEFIANAREDVPYLLALVREQAAQIGRVKALAERFEEMASVASYTDTEAVMESLLEAANMIRTALSGEGQE